MATLGQQFKAAREAKGVSEAEAGSATKILTKLIIGMEADDFSLMPAPTYAKGFIRLYSEYLELDSVPLVQEYLEKHSTGPRPLGKQQKPHSQRDGNFSVKVKKIPFHIPQISMPKKAGGLISSAAEKIKQTTGRGWSALPGNAWKDVRILAGAAAALIILLVLISTISTCTRNRTAEPPTPAPQTAPARNLLDDPAPDLYLVAPGTIESSR